MWLHCKNVEAAKSLHVFQSFCHTGDPYSYTSHGKVWLHDLEQTFDFIQDKEDKKFKHSHLWSLIPLTRPIDTLIITLKDSEADYVKKLKTIVNEYRDFVCWIN